MFKRILIIVCSICILTLSAKSQTSTGNENEDSPGLVGGDPDAAPTEVPFDDYVPFMIAGVIVYGVLMNRQKKVVHVASITR